MLTCEMFVGSLNSATILQYDEQSGTLYKLRREGEKWTSLLQRHFRLSTLSTLAQLKNTERPTQCTSKASTVQVTQDINLNKHKCHIR